MAGLKKSPRKRTPRARSTTLSSTKATRELEELNRIGIALSETRDVEQLLDLILKKAREITAVDAGSLYLAERRGVSVNGGLQAPRFRFMLTQNGSAPFPFSGYTLPLTEESMAGYCALHGEVIELADAYRIPKSRPFHSTRHLNSSVFFLMPRFTGWRRKLPSLLFTVLIGFFSTL